MVLLGGICYVLLGHLILPQEWREKVAKGLYLPLAEACAGKRKWADVTGQTVDAEVAEPTPASVADGQDFPVT